MSEVRFLSPVSAEGRFIRQQSEPGRYGHILLVVEPNSEPGLTFSWEVSEHDIPSSYADSIFSGIRQVFSSGRAMEGAECTHTKVRIVGGSFHETDSSPLCYKAAACIAFEQALQKAGCMPHA